MNMSDIPFGTTDWAAVPETVYPDEPAPRAGVPASSAAYGCGSSSIRRVI